MSTTCGPAAPKIPTAGANSSTQVILLTAPRRPTQGIQSVPSAHREAHRGATVVAVRRDPDKDARLPCFTTSPGKRHLSGVE